jgi:cell division protein FtsN
MTIVSGKGKRKHDATSSTAVAASSAPPPTSTTTSSTTTTVASSSTTKKSMNDAPTGEARDAAALPNAAESGVASEFAKEFIDFFWQLSEFDASVRAKAVAALVAHIGKLLCQQKKKKKKKKLKRRFFSFSASSVAWRSEFT